MPSNLSRDCWLLLVYSKSIPLILLILINALNTLLFYSHTNYIKNITLKKIALGKSEN